MLFRNFSVLFVEMMIGIGRISSTDRNIDAPGVARHLKFSATADQPVADTS